MLKVASTTLIKKVPMCSNSSSESCDFFPVPCFDLSGPRCKCSLMSSAPKMQLQLLLHSWYAPDQSQGHGIFHDWWTGTAVPGYNATISACEKSCEWRLPLHLLQHLDDVDVVRCWDHESAWYVHGSCNEFTTTLDNTQSKLTRLAMLIETRQCHTQHTSE